ncbi:MAG TPA: DUF3459 domain-containing protein [Chthoniobacterales bacterium]|nr:DUF3459 domain-containing protein [Chthoniobacterales bacterium]
MLTGARDGYYKFYRGTVDELAATIDHGWLLEGEERAPQLLGRPGAAMSLEPEKFVVCIANHDQVGNQAFGLRLNQLISPAAYRAASALLCLVPYTPLILMGQEWAASTPFLYFTDHNPQLGRKVTEGRRDEFRSFSAFRDPASQTGIPDPQVEETFLRSKLKWEEIDEGRHADILRLYQEFLRLRRDEPVLRDRSRANFRVLKPADGILPISFGRSDGEQWLILADLIGAHSTPLSENDQVWQLVLSSNEKRFGGEGGPAFAQAEVCVFRLTNSI